MASIESVFDNDVIQGVPDEDNYIEAWGFRASVVGSNGNDTINVEGYLSTVEGGDGNDYITASTSYVILDGGAGDDIVCVNAWLDNIANVSMTGGDGEDAFVFRPTSFGETSSNGETYSRLGNIYGSTVMDFNAAEDYIVLQNIGAADYSNPNALNLYFRRNIDRELIFDDFAGRVTFRMSGVSHFGDIAQGRIGFNDIDTGDHLATLTFADAVPFIDLGSGVKMLNNRLILESTVESDIQLSNDSFRYIDAVDDSVGGRALIGNNLNNWIYAGDYGNKLWGRGGTDYLIGGDGADTFYAGQGEGDVYIYHCDDNDVLKLWNVNAGDLSGVEFDTFEGYEPDGVQAYERVHINLNDGTVIDVSRPDDAYSLTVQLADGGTFRFLYDDNTWEQIDYNFISPLEPNDDPEGLMTLPGMAVIGGAGADTFRAGRNEDSLRVANYGSDDIVLFYDFNFADVTNLYVESNDYSTFVMGNAGDDFYFEIQSSTADSLMTAFQFADGSFMHYDLSKNIWQRSPDGSTWNTFNEVNGTPVGLDFYDGIVGVFSDFNGAFRLANLDNDSLIDISALSDNVKGRVLVGDDQDNYIFANNYGSSLWGGDGNDTLIGGAGADTFKAGLNEGNLHVTDYGNNDLIHFYNFNFSNINNLYVTRDELNTFVTGNAGEDFYFEIQSSTADSQTTTFKFRDGSFMRYDPSDNVWQRSTNGSTWRTITEVNGTPVGLDFYEDFVDVHVDFNGAFRLANLNNDSLINVSAVNDTLSGRVLVGDAQDNYIFANNYGSSIWGGDGDDTLIGGAGNDTFKAGLNEGNLRVTDYGNGDLIFFYDFNFADINNLYVETNETNTFVMGNAGDSLSFEIHSPTEGSQTTVFRFADGSRLRYDPSDNVWQRSTNGSTWRTITAVNGNPVGTFELDGVIYLMNDCPDNFSLDDYGDGSFESVTGYFITDEGAHISGNSADNRVRGSYYVGSWLCGGDGDDTLVGGNGVDTFEARQGEGNTLISLCSANDVVYLSNVNYSDLKFLSNAVSGDDERVTRLTADDYTSVMITSAIGESSTTILLADNSTLKYDAVDNSWQRSTDGSTWRTITSINGTPVGVETYEFLVDVFSDYVGNFDLNDLNDSSVTVVDAGFDTLSGRVIIGDDQNNYIFANDYGSSIYGGNGSDTLLGGDGNDTFRAGMGEGDAIIGNCSSDDLVDLWNINFEDIATMYVIERNSYRNPSLIINDGTTVVVWTELEETTTNFRLADGSKLRYNATDNTWQRNVTYANAWTSIGSVYDGTPVGLFNDGEGMLYVYSDFNGAVDLNELGDGSISNIYALNDSVEGRVLVGDENDNMILAGSGGVSLDGGNGGDDILVGGAGADTFVAGLDEGLTDILYCADNDLIVLRNISSYDVLVGNTVDMIAHNTDSGTTIAVSTSDSTVCNVWYSTGVTETNFLLSDGTRFKFDYEESAWQTVYNSADDELAALLSIDLNDLSTAVGTENAFDLSAFDEPINDGSSLIMKYATEFHRRKND